MSDSRQHYRLLNMRSRRQSWRGSSDMTMERHFPPSPPNQNSFMMSLFLELTMPIRWALIQMDPLRNFLGSLRLLCLNFAFQIHSHLKLLSCNHGFETGVSLLIRLSNVPTQIILKSPILYVIRGKLKTYAPFQNKECSFLV
jgi:hypothetical protein